MASWNPRQSSPMIVFISLNEKALYHHWSDKHERFLKDVCSIHSFIQTLLQAWTISRWEMIHTSIVLCRCVHSRQYLRVDKWTANSYLALLVTSEGNTTQPGGTGFSGYNYCLESQEFCLCISQTKWLSLYTILRNFPPSGGKIGASNHWCSQPIKLGISESSSLQISTLSWKDSDGSCLAHMSVSSEPSLGVETTWVWFRSISMKPYRERIYVYTFTDAYLKHFPWVTNWKAILQTCFFQVCMLIKE